MILLRFLSWCLHDVVMSFWQNAWFEQEASSRHDVILLLLNDVIVTVPSNHSMHDASFAYHDASFTYHDTADASFACRDKLFTYHDNTFTCSLIMTHRYRISLSWRIVHVYHDAPFTHHDALSTYRDALFTYNNAPFTYHDASFTYRDASSRIMTHCLRIITHHSRIMTHR